MHDEPEAGKPGSADELAARIRKEIEERITPDIVRRPSPKNAELPRPVNPSISCPTGVAELVVKTLAMDSESHGPVMILTDRQERIFLPIWIGVFEAQAITAEMEGRPNSKEGRPMTHDLLRHALELVGARVTKAVIVELKDQTYYARLHLNNGSDLELDARPSDAVALALMFKAPIFGSAEVLSKAGILDQTKVSEEEKNAGEVHLS
jgi:hypothetical protein